MDEEIRKALTDLTVPLWPTAGQALGLGREATYESIGAGVTDAERRETRTQKDRTPAQIA